MEMGNPEDRLEQNNDSKKGGCPVREKSSMMVVKIMRFRRRKGIDH